MSNYDFTSLNDKDFEVLVTDLLSLEHGKRFERFKPGKDGGIDGRYFTAKGTQAIFQCKHWAKTGLQPLLRSLKDTELPKVKKLKPAQYILATSVPLSANDKKAITSIFTPWIKSESDVFGCEDINDLLRKHNQVEKAHFKLWLHSTEVLSIISNSAILGRSEFTLKEISEKNVSYVPLLSHGSAKEKLQNGGVLLITGEPGIGKTTLAEQLCLEHVAQGYQLCVAAKQVEELEALYHVDQKQVFYFDDFLGSNFLQALDRHEDSHISGFIKRVSKDKSKRLILTSRTTVLNRGKVLTERFRNEKIDRHEFELEVKSLSDLEKAKILHSCIWHSQLPRPYLDEVVKDKRYWEIIQHENFNPRLISFITDLERFPNVPPHEYWTYIESKLNNPSDIWHHAYDNQLNDYSRALLILVVASGNNISEADLIKSYEHLLNENIVRTYSGEADFIRCTELLVGSVLNRSITKDGSAVYTLFNPSIADYVLQRISKDLPTLCSYFSALNNSASLRILRDLKGNDLLGDDAISKVLGYLCEKKLTTFHPEADTVYKLQICLSVLNLPKPPHAAINTVISYMKLLALSPEKHANTGTAFKVLAALQEESLLPGELAEAFIQDCEFYDFDHDELLNASKIISSLPLEIALLTTDELKTAIVEFWQNFFQKELVDRDTLGEFFNVQETAEAAEIATRELNEILAEYNISLSEYEKSEILRYLDIDDIINGNIKRSINSDFSDDLENHFSTNEVEVDDLFSIDLPSN